MVAAVPHEGGSTSERVLVTALEPARDVGGRLNRQGVVEIEPSHAYASYKGAADARRSAALRL